MFLGSVLALLLAGRGILGFGRSRHEAVEDMDLGSGQNRPQSDPFFDMGDKKDPAAGGGKRRGDALGAEAVGVGLDHCAQGGAAEAFAHAAIVGDDRVEIDGQDGAGQTGIRQDGLRHGDQNDWA